MSKHKPIEIPVPNRKHLARAERERMLTRWVWIGTALTLAAVLGLVGWGLINQYVLQPKQPVAQVGEAKISTEDFQKAVKYQRVSLFGQYAYLQNLAQFFGDNQTINSQIQQIEYQISYPIALGTTVLDQLIEDEIIRQEAAKRGIAVSEDELTKAMQESFGYYPDGTPTPIPSETLPPTATLSPTDAAATDTAPTATSSPTATSAPTATPDPSAVPTQTVTPGPSVTPLPTSTPLPTATPITAEGYRQLYTQRLEDLKKLTGMNEADILRLYEMQLLREKVREALTADVSNVREEVHARHILVPDEALAEEIAKRAKAGEDFAELAKQYSTDTSNKDQGGDLQWFGKGDMVAEFEAVAFNTPVGEISDPVQTQFGWHVIQVLGHEERPLDEGGLEAEKDKAFRAWLDEQREGDAVKTYDYWTERVPEGPSFEEIAAAQEPASQ